MKVTVSKACEEGGTQVAITAILQPEGHAHIKAEPGFEDFARNLKDAGVNGVAATEGEPFLDAILRTYNTGYYSAQKES